MFAATDPTTSSEQEFDSSFRRNKPFQFSIGLGQVGHFMCLPRVQLRQCGFNQVFSSQSAHPSDIRCLDFHVSQVIRGWDEGVMKMSLGEKAKLIITSDYGLCKQYQKCFFLDSRTKIPLTVPAFLACEAQILPPSKLKNQV